MILAESLLKVISLFPLRFLFLFIVLFPSIGIRKVKAQFCIHEIENTLPFCSLNRRTNRLVKHTPERDLKHERAREKQKLDRPGIDTGTIDPYEKKKEGKMCVCVYVERVVQAMPCFDTFWRPDGVLGERGYW